MITKKRTIHIFEASKSLINVFVLLVLLVQKRRIYIIEPFHAFHNKSNIRFFPERIPRLIQRLIAASKVGIIRAADFKAKTVYLDSSDQAVKSVESVYPGYRNHFEKIIRFINGIARSVEAERIYKKLLCEHLAEYYSISILLHNIAALYPDDLIKLHPVFDVVAFSKMAGFISDKKAYFIKNLRINRLYLYYGYMANFIKSIVMLSKICAIAVFSCVIAIFNSFKNTPKTSKYKIGFLVKSPSRQFRHDGRGPDLVIDNKKIKRNQIIVFYLPHVSKTQQGELGKHYAIEFPNKISMHIFDNKKWRGILSVIFKFSFTKDYDEIFETILFVYRYLRWEHALETVSVEHFISAADFDKDHIPRNILLHKAGAQTWYYTDSMNLPLCFSNKKIHGTHPFWAYLYYDHFVTWDNAIIHYMQSHPASFNHYHNIGCLWKPGHAASMIQKKMKASKISVKKSYLISVFDSTYSYNGLTDYTEGISFAKDIIYIANYFDDCIVIF